MDFVSRNSSDSLHARHESGGLAPVVFVIFGPRDKISARGPKKPPVGKNYVPRA